MSILQSDLLNDLIDNNPIIDNDYQDKNENPIGNYNPIQHYDQVKIDNMYDLLKNHANDNINHSSKTELSNNNLHLFNRYQFNNNINQYLEKQPPIYTINPRQLNPQKSNITTANSSSNSEFDSDSDQLDLMTNSTNNSSVKSLPSGNNKNNHINNNWSMNDEFNNAIAIWVNENQTRSKKSNSISNGSSTSTIPKFQRTSITKRRKSDSLVNSLPNLSLNDPISASAITSSTTPTTATNSIKSTSPSLTTSSTTTTTTTSSSNSTASSIPSTPSINASASSNNTSIIPEEEDDDDKKLFKCEGCPKAFRRSEHLKRHFRSVHSNVRPFPCKFCEKKFSRSDNLAQHLRTHNRH